MSAARGGFWLQHSSQGAKEAVDYASALAASDAGRPGVSFGPVNAPSTLSKLFQRARADGDAILDAQGHLLDRDHKPRMRERFPWLTQEPRPVTQSEWEAWMLESLKHQRSVELCGDGQTPSFLMTPSPILSPAGGAPELHAVLDAAQAIRATIPADRECWMSVTVERDYLMNTRHLTALLNAVLAVKPQGVVVRAPQTELVPVTIAGYLTGLREVVQTLASNRIDVFLPSTGWLGWMAMGWGAWGFSSGLANTTWVDRAPGFARTPAIPPNYYFESQLLRPVRWALHEELAGRGDHDPCTCPECEDMGDQWDAALAKRHQIRMANTAAARLTALPASDRRAVVQTRIARAVDYRDGLPKIVADRADVRFLDVWAEVA